MPSFKYEAVNHKGKMQRGSLWAQNKQKAILELRGGGLTVKSLEEKKSSILDMEISLGSRISRKEFVVFCRQFSTLIRSGIQIDQALRLLANQSKVKAMKKALSEVLDQLRAGQQLSEALSKRPRDFPPMFVNMIASGEVGGNLDEILEHMADHYEKESKSLQKVRSALTYPLIVLVVASAVVVFLLRNIVPTFEGLFAEQGAELPAITKAVVAASGFMELYWYVLLGGLLLPFLALRGLLLTKSGRYWFDYVKYQMPIFGSLLKKSTLARMARTMAALFFGGIPIMQILSVSEKIVQNEVAASVLRQAREKMEEGKQLSEPFRESGFFPDMFNQVIQVGEETGQMDVMLAKVAEYYEADVERAIEQIKTMIEPALMLGLTAVVGMIVAAIITPMFSLYEQILQ